MEGSLKAHRPAAPRSGGQVLVESEEYNRTYEGPTTTATTQCIVALPLYGAIVLCHRKFVVIAFAALFRYVCPAYA